MIDSNFLFENSVTNVSPTKSAFIKENYFYVSIVLALFSNPVELDSVSRNLDGKKYTIKRFLLTAFQLAILYHQFAYI